MQAQSITSPFPGMNPYLESHWGDVRASLLTYAADAIQPQLPDDLRARIHERSVWECDRFQFDGSEQMTEAFIEIRTARTGLPIITAIECVGPWHKRLGSAQEQYQKSRADRMRNGVNLVEIDLLRAGEGVFRFSEQSVPLSQRTPYRIAVWRACKPDQVEYYPITMQQRLPAIAIPLRESDRDVPLDLQPILDQAYRNGRYDDLDYTREPDPPLVGEDAAWAAAHLHQQGRRA